MPTKPFSLEQLLETAPLYQNVAIQMIGPEGMEPFVGAPQSVKLYCDACDHDTTWQLTGAPGASEVIAYVCKNCPANAREVRFALRWEITRRTETKHGGPFGTYDVKIAEGRVTKYGQFPEIAERVSKDLAKQMDAVHLRYYRNAVRLRNFGLGIAALAYMRRVVEDNVNRLLDIVVEEAKLAGDTTIDLVELERVKAGRVFDKKIEYAKAKLPLRLVIGGHNPLDKLHAVTSEGIHALSDDECVEVFDGARLVFEYFFENLPEQQRKEKEYGSAVSKLGSKSSPASIADNGSSES